MSDPTTEMYMLPPINVLSPCSPPDVMYKMPNILANLNKHDGSHVAADIDAKMPDDVVTEQKSLQDYSALEARQEKVLDQLAKLKDQVQTMCHFLKQGDHRVETTQQIHAPLKESKKLQKIDLIAYANVLKPPYSIFALKKLWRNTSIQVHTFVHSTADGITPIFIPNNHTLDANYVITLTLIWKKEQFKLIKDVNCPLLGEVNFLRFLSRKIDGLHNYDKNIGLHGNRILDLCYCLSEIEKSIDLTNELDELESIVSTSEVLRGGLPCIPEIAVWSTLKAHFFPNKSFSNKLPKSIKEVYKICEEMFMDNELAHDSDK